MSGFKDRLNSWSYALTGRKPWTRGYMPVRNALIGRAIDQVIKTGAFEPGPGHGIGMDERVVEYPWFFASMAKGTSRLLDAGSTLNHAMVVDRLPLAELKLFIATLAPEHLSFWQRGVSYTYEDLRDLSFRDGYFDCIAALSSLEHVGMDNTLLYTDQGKFKEQSPQDYLQVVAQLKRVLRPGGQFLVTLPYGVAESFGWSQQFDRKMLQGFIDAFGPSEHSLQFFRYRPSGWSAARQDECDDARYYDVHRGGALDPDLAAASRAVACLRLTK